MNQALKKVIKDNNGDATLYAICECDECDPVFRCWQRANPCIRLPHPPVGYTAEELERDNPYNAWLQEG